MKPFLLRLVGCLFVVISSNSYGAWGGVSWGAMTWGYTQATVPLMGSVGQLILLIALLVIGCITVKRSGASKALTAGAMLVTLPLFVDAQAIHLNTFQNGQVADADEVNQNFNNLKAAIENSSGLGTIVSRSSTPTPGQVPGYTAEQYAAAIMCQTDEIAISGSCSFNRSPDGYVDGQMESNFLQNNEQICTATVWGGVEDGVTLTAHINCLSQ